MVSDKSVGLCADEFDGLPEISYVSRSNRLHYVPTPKVACTSLKWWFARLEGFDPTPADFRQSWETEPDLVIHDSLPRLFPKVLPTSREDELEIFNSPDYFRFAVVRNPYKRLFSAWQSKLLLKEPFQIGPYLDCDFFNHPILKLEDVAVAFEGFLEYIAAHEWPHITNPHWAPQTEVLRVGKVNYSMIAQIENPNPLWEKIRAQVGGEDFQPPPKSRANESLIPYLPEFFSSRSQELIEQLYGEDFDYFGYAKGLPPAKESFTQEQFDVAMKAVNMLQGRNRRFGEVRELLEEREKDVGVLRHALEEQEKEVSALRHAAQAPTLQVGELLEKLQASEAANGALRAEVERLARDLEGLRNSLSWRVTKPLRWLLACLRSQR